MNAMFLDIYTSNILKKLAKNKFMVKVPEIALQTETELNESYNSRFYVDNIEIPRDKRNVYMPDSYSDENEFKYTLATPVVEYAESGVSKPNLSLTQVYIPVTEIIDIYTSGMSIYIVGKDNLVKLVKLLSNAINDLKQAADVINADEASEQINSFLETIIENKRGTIKDEFNKPKPAIAAGLGGPVSVDLISDGKKARPYMDLTDIIIA